MSTCVVTMLYSAVLRLYGRSRNSKILKVCISPNTCMKDYDHVIIWLDYFNKNLSRSQGRRLNKDYSVSSPLLDDLSSAAKMAGYTIHSANYKARHPRRSNLRSGYVVISKTDPKTRVLYKIAPKLMRVAKSCKKK